MVLGGRRWGTLSIHLSGRSASAARFSGRISRFVSKRPIWLAESAEPVIARSPTTQRIAGSQHSDQRHSRPHSRRAARTPIGAANRPADGDRSYRCAHRQECRPRCQSVAGGVLAVGKQPCIRPDRGTPKLQRQATVEIEPQRTPVTSSSGSLILARLDPPRQTGSYP